MLFDKKNKKDVPTAAENVSENNAEREILTGENAKAIAENTEPVNEHTEPVNEHKKNKKEKREKKAKQGKNFPLGYVLFAVTFIVMGVCFIAFTSQAIAVMCYLIGGVTVLTAVFNAAGALADKNRGGGFYLKMILCVFAVVSGIVVMVGKGVALEYVVGAAAFLLVIDASFKLQTAIRGRAFKIPLWWTLVVLVIVCYVGTGYLIKFYNVEQTGLMVGILGGVLIVDGILNFLTPVYLSLFDKNEKKVQEDLSTEQNEQN